MNNKGQSLVLFVLLIPLILLILFMVYNIGQMTLLRHELDNINVIAINFAIDKIDDEFVINNTRELILKNKDDIDNIEINIDNNKIYISLEDNVSQNISLFKNIFLVKSSYVGYVDNDKRIIERYR